jgi:hypothetical protein
MAGRHSFATLRARMTPESQIAAEAEAVRLGEQMDLGEVRRALKLSQDEIAQTLQMGKVRSPRSKSAPTCMSAPCAGSSRQWAESWRLSRDFQITPSPSRISPTWRSGRGREELPPAGWTNHQTPFETESRTGMTANHTAEQSGSCQLTVQDVR